MPSSPKRTANPGPGVALPLVWLACVTPGASGTFADCADAACRQRWVVEHWESDRADAIAAVVETAEPVEQIALVRALARQHTGSIGALCDALPPGPAQKNCRQIESRRHLVESRPPGPAGGGRQAPGPTSWRLDVSRLPASPLADQRLVDDPCTGGDQDCRMQAAVASAARGDAASAAALCASVAESTMAAECAFQAAEARLRTESAEESGIGDAVDLCLLSGRFADACLAHIPLRIAKAQPAVDRAGAADWRRLAAQEAVLRDAVVSRGAPDLGEALQGLFWAETTTVMYTQTPAIVGDPLDALPAEAAPHVRAAAALSLARWRSSGDPPADLAALSTELDGLLQRRAPLSGAPASHDGGTRPGDDLWPIDRPGEESIPAVVYAGTSRRAWARDDPAADLRICILEAWARTHPEDNGPLEQGLSDPDELVAFTARRLSALRVPRRSGGPPARY